MTREERVAEAYAEGVAEAVLLRNTNPRIYTVMGLKSRYSQVEEIPWMGKNLRKPFFSDALEAFKRGYLEGYPR